MDYFTRTGVNNERLLKNFSINEFHNICIGYKELFKTQLRQPTADNNHIINYNLKISNYVMVNQFIHMMTSGASLFLIQALAGRHIERLTVNYLGQKRGQWAQIGFYVLGFFYMNSILNRNKRLNVNHLINPRDFNGEVLLSLILKYYPHKVNTDLYRKIMAEKYEGQLLKINFYEQQILEKPDYYQLNNPDAVNNYLQHHQAQQAPQHHQQQGNPMNQGLNLMPGQQLQPQMNMMANQQQMMQQQQQQMAQQHAQQQHLQKLQAQQQVLQIQKPQPQIQQQDLSMVPQQVNLTPAQIEQLKPEDRDQFKTLEATKKRILDQMRDQQDQSPYLSTNKEFGRANDSQQQSPYFLIQKQINKEQTQSSAVFFAPQEQKQQINYQGHYSHIVNQAKRDSS
ncbi:UNKNOWN [Stylonychia lemnae]|uniref:Transmembrane protein n=1 Tax=Stylonychia lemnae TaxID=5949 RepID=A0A077ZQC1_STYLE|nr:UNKNOWN [Stylonychia lemnae]|eukprot:CDW72108.1 UNKNOWN [Stylonychia lemnae]